MFNLKRISGVWSEEIVQYVGCKALLSTLQTIKRGFFFNITLEKEILLVVNQECGKKIVVLSRC